MNSSEPVGTIRVLWRFPVKSMLGEELDATGLTDGRDRRRPRVRDPGQGNGQGGEREAREAVANLLNAGRPSSNRRAQLTGFHRCGSSSPTGTRS
jgi:hypothetical protein